MTDDSHFRLRLPASLKERIQEAAEENHRSINAEVVARLEASFGGDDTIFTEEQEAVLRDLVAAQMDDWLDQIAAKNPGMVKLVRPS